MRRPEDKSIRAMIVGALAHDFRSPAEAVLNILRKAEKILEMPEWHQSEVLGQAVRSALRDWNEFVSWLESDYIGEELRRTVKLLAAREFPSNSDLVVFIDTQLRRPIDHIEESVNRFRSEIMIFHQDGRAQRYVGRELRGSLMECYKDLSTVLSKIRGLLATLVLLASKEQTPRKDIIVSDNLEADLRVLFENVDKPFQFSSAGSVRFTADYGQIWAVLQNLVFNAFKFHKVGQAVKIELLWGLVSRGQLPYFFKEEERARSNKWVQIGVRDYGIGIPMNDAQYIFGAFKQLSYEHYPEGSSGHRRLRQRRAEPNDVEQRGSDRELGTGLGLALCDYFVSLHGGRIRVGSKEGGPTTFVFWIPDPSAEAVRSARFPVEWSPPPVTH